MHFQLLRLAVNSIDVGVDEKESNKFFVVFTHDDKEFSVVDIVEHGV